MYAFGPPGWSPDGSRDTADAIRAAWEAERGVIRPDRPAAAAAAR
jgi:hypothetical protein